MYNMLIVDDEPMIVDSLYRLIADLERPDLELLRAYDVIEAMEWLQGTRVDIVLSDIRMPGMSGIQLQKEIRRLWPRCRIIFLTGFSEFDYAQEAIRGGGIVDYLVKTDGDQTIVRAVEKAIGEIESSLLDEHFLLKSKANMRQALPMLQKEYLLDMLQGERQTAKARADKFAELDIRLEPEAPLLLLIGRVDGWDGHYTSSDRTLFVFAIQNIVEEYMQIESNVAAISYDSQTMIWLIQPAETADEPERFAMARWDKLKHYAYQTLEPIQETCRKLLKVSLSFVMANSETEWDMLEPRFNKLKFLLGNRYGLEEEVIVLEHETENDGDAQYQTVRTQRGRLLGQLEGWLEKGQKDKFLLVLDDYMRLELPAKEFHLFEAFYPLALFFMSYVNRNGQFRQLLAPADLHKLMAMNEHSSWQGVIRYFRGLTDLLFASLESGNDERTGKVVQYLDRYIQTHIHLDLSLTTLAELVHHSPTYLSKLYKREKGMLLSDYITTMRMEKARELLISAGHLKIQEIAAAVGYEAAAYFTRYFKKMFTLTPQEFRDKYAEMKADTKER